MDEAAYAAFVESEASDDAVPRPDTGSAQLETPATEFARRHIGPGPDDIAAMLKVVGAASLEEMAARTVPAAIAGPISRPCRRRPPRPRRSPSCARCRERQPRRSR